MSLEGSELEGSKSLDELNLNMRKIIQISNEPFITATVKYYEKDKNPVPCDYRIRPSDADLIACWKSIG